MNEKKDLNRDDKQRTNKQTNEKQQNMAAVSYEHGKHKVIPTHPLSGCPIYFQLLHTILSINMSRCTCKVLLLYFRFGRDAVHHI